jgi:alkylation response protein AidB-like acyl-CoA dehydrogenase
MPAGSIFPWSISAVPLGIARGAIDAFVAQASRTGPGASAPLRDREAVQTVVGRAEAMHRAARAGLVEAMTELVAALAAGGERLVTARAMFRVAAPHATEAAVGIIDMLATSAGSASIFETCPIERAVRDVRAAARHVALSGGNYTVAGRVALGLDPGTARF